MAAELVHHRHIKGTMPIRKLKTAGVYVVVDAESGDIIGRADTEIGCAMLWIPGTYWGYHPVDPEIAARRARVYVDQRVTR